MSKCKITGKVLSIRIGREEIQIALVGGGDEILYSTVIPTPVGAVEDGLIRNKEALCAALRTALKAPEIKSVRWAVFSLCTSQVIAETVVTPDLPIARLEKLLQANVDMYFPVDMQDYQMVWQVIGPKANDNGLKELSVQLWAVPNAMIAMYYSVANACGLSVLAIDYCGHSVATAVGASFSRQTKAGKAKQKINWNQDISLASKKKEALEATADASAGEVRQIVETDLYVSLERDLLGMTFVQNNHVVFQRFIPCGVNPAYQFSELAMMLEYFYSLDGSRSNMIRGFVTGVLSADAQLIAELENAIGISLTAFAPGYAPYWTICVGAARTTLDFGNATLNRPTKNRKRVQTQIWQYASVLGSGVALIAVIMFTLSAKLVWDSNLEKMETQRYTLAIRAQQNTGNADRYNKYSANYDSYSADWDSVFSSLWTYNNNLALVLQELEDVLPEKTSVENLQIAEDGITIELACENKEEAAYLIMALRKLKYADVKSISNLSGGARPATSSGPEKAPTEGSSDLTVQENSPLFKLIADELSKEELLELSASLTPEEIFLLEKVYGKQPETKYSGIEALKNGNAEMDQEQFFKLRSDGLREMLTSNPFAINRFSKLLDDEFYRPKEEQYLLRYILADIFRLQEEGLFGGEANDAETTLKQMNALVDVLTKDPETLGHAEDLFTTDKVMELWYVYYAELQLNMQQREEYVYLNIDKVIEDLLDGGFDTDNEVLDSKLNGLISEQTRTLLSSVGTEEGMTELMNKYLDEGSTGNTNADAIIEAYLTTGTTGNTRLDNLIEGYINSGAMDAKAGSLIDKYIQKGTTGNSTVDMLVEQYFTNGTTGNPKLDAVFKKHIDSISSGLTKEQVAELVDKYIAEGTTGNVLYDKLIEKYFTEGTTGNDQLDKLIEEYMKEGDIQGGFTKEQVADMMNKYASEGTTGNTLYDKLIEKYLAEGSTGNQQLDKLIDEYMAEAGGTDNSFTKDQVAELMNKYLADGTTGNELYDMMIKKYLKEGTTGNKKLDDMIDSYLSDCLNSDTVNSITRQELDQLLNSYISKGTTGNKLYDFMIDKYLSEGTTGNAKIDKLIGELLKDMAGNGGNSGNGGASSESKDNRIHFTVSLGYNDELKNAELDRKGLSYEDKIDKLEVAE